MSEFKVDAEGFIEWANATKSKFRLMVRTMKNVAEIIGLATIPYVPLDTSALEQSYTYMVTNSSPFIIMAVGFDAVDEKSGFHYAQYQHDNFLHHPKRGIPYYLTVGIHDAKHEFFELIEQDYLSLFHTGKVSEGRTNIDERLTGREVFFDLEDWLTWQ